MLDVQATSAELRPLPVQLQSVGKVVAENSVEVRAQTSGMLKQVFVQDGQLVKAGQPLLAALALAQAQWVRDTALADDAAAAQARLKPLAEKEYVTAHDYELAVSNTRSLQASAAATQTLIEQARIALAHATISAPIAGRAGAVLVQAGNLVAANGATPLLVINAISPLALAARKLGFDQLVSAILAGHSNAPIGTLNGTARSYTVKADGQLHDAAEFGHLVLAYQNGQPVRFNAVGRAVESVENIRTSAFINEQRAIELNLRRQPGGNTVVVTRAARLAVEEIRAQLPADVQLQVLYDRGDYINASIHDVELTLLASLLLVVLVIMLFLRQFVGHADRGRGAADVADRHLWRDGPARLQLEQCVVAGADAGRRPNGGRRHRGV
jgi:multidrug efflux pump subunit AcrA (membrane-fusion protein)